MTDSSGRAAPAGALVVRPGGSERARYHSPLREGQAAATSARILEAAVAILQAGGSLTYGAVAARAEVKQRTVYRHFPTREDLESAVWQWILDHLTHVDFSAATLEQLVAALHRSFAGFDAGAPLIQAMLCSAEGQRVRLHQQPGRRAMFEACLDAAVPGLDPQDRLAAAAALQVLYSASAWDQLRTFWGMAAPQSADVIELAIRALVDGLRLRTSPPKEETE
jgi:AcrR family transcriptional regulator